MNGFHFTVVGAMVTVALAYWLIRYGSGAYNIATGGSKAVGNIGRTFTANPGSA